MTISSKYYSGLANLLVLGLIIYSSVNFGMIILEHQMKSQIKIKAPQGTAMNKVKAMRTLPDYQSLVRKNMFAPDAVTVIPESPQSSSRAAPEPFQSNEFRLMGTMANQRPDLSYAIIESIKTKVQELVRVGEMVGQARLTRIEPGEVQVTQEGKVYSIILQEPKRRRSASSSRNRARANTRANTSSRARRQAKEDDAEDRRKTPRLARAVGGNKFVVSRDALNRDMSDLYGFMSQINIKPFRKAGKPHGFMLSAIRRNSVFQQLGLMNNDVIVKLNGVAVRQPEDVMGLYNQIQQLDNITLEIERRGRLQTLTYTLK